jgi:hypothetical protein
MESLARQGLRITGPPPSKGAPKIEVLMWIRRFYIRILLITIPAWILLVFIGPAWAWIGLGVSGAVWLQGFISLNFRIKRLRSAPPNN